MTLALFARKSPIARMLAVLRRYGSNAHLYLPGVGVINGVTAGNYLDSAGSTPASVDSLVGLVLDALGNIGAELITDPDINTGSASWTTYTAGSGTVVFGTGIATLNSVSGIDAALLRPTGLVCVTGKTYRARVVASGVSGTPGISVNGETINSAPLANGVNELVFTYTSGNPVVIKRIGNPSTAVIESFSLREIPGIHATQATTGNKPWLRRSQSTYRWDGLGAQSLQLGSLPFGAADDHYICSVARCDNDAGSWAIFSAASSASATPLIELDFNTGYPRALYRDDASTLVTMQHTSKVVGSPVCLSMRNIAGSKVLRVNGALSTSSGSALGTCSLTSAALMARPTATPSNQLPGGIYGFIAIKGTVGNSDVLAIERGLNCLSQYAAGRF